MSVNKAEIQWEVEKEENNRKWEKPNQYFNCSRQAEVSRLFISSHKFSPLLRAVAVSSKCPLCSIYRSVLFRLGEVQSFRKVCVSPLRKTLFLGNLSSPGDIISPLSLDGSPSTPPLLPGKKHFKFQEPLVY